MLAPHERVARRSAVWRRLCGAWSARAVSQGVKIGLLRRPPLIYIPTALPSDPTRAREISRQVRSLLEAGTVSPVRRQDLHCVLPIFLVAKKGINKWRLVHDLRRLNDHVRYRHFRLAGTSVVRQMIRRRDWAVTLDMSSAYHHLAIHPAHRRLLGFALGGQHYQFNALEFGISSAPRLFTKLLQPLLRRWRCYSAVEEPTRQGRRIRQ